MDETGLADITIRFKGSDCSIDYLKTLIREGMFANQGEGWTKVGYQLHHNRE
jgi:hypothetical protein